jgi:hypothetical protein
MPRRAISLSATFAAALIVAASVWTLSRGGSSSSVAKDANERAVLESPVLRRLLHGARVVRIETQWVQGCQTELTAVLDRRVHIRDSGITASASDGNCHVKRWSTWSLDAVGVPSISFALDRYTHRITYISPNWGESGAHLRDQHWDGPDLGFPPGGD